MPKIIQRLTLSLVISLFTFIVLNLKVRPIDADGIITVGNGCSLIEAIQAANTDSPVGACATGNLTDTIILQANTVYILTAIDNGSFNNYNGLPAITSTIVMSGNGATIELSAASATPDFRIFYVGGTGDLTLCDMTIHNGGFATYGGGVHNDGALTVNNITLSDNSAYYGGGIWNEGTLTVTNSAFLYNSSTYGGGGIFSESALTVNDSTFSHNSAFGFGGGIYNAGTLTVNDSTLSHNSADFGGSGAGIKNEGVLTVSNSTLSHNSAYNYGGGIWNEGTLAVSNSTLSHNSAVGFRGFGGGIHNDGTLTVSNSAIVNNRADNNSDGSGSGGGICQRDGSASVVNTILAGNTANNGGAPDCAGELTSGNYNLIQDTTGCTISDTSIGNITGQDPLLGPLANNGGNTQTHALLPGSPVINAGDPAFTSPPHFDQRGLGFPRVVGGRVDIGAFEWNLTYIYLPIVLK